MFMDNNNSNKSEEKYGKAHFSTGTESGSGSSDGQSHNGGSFTPGKASSSASVSGGGGGMSKKTMTIIGAVTAAVLVIAVVVIIPLKFGGVSKVWHEINGGEVKYSYVLVHGLGGFGNDRNLPASYWGAGACDLEQYLEEKGYDVIAPSVGPYSSAWDRACELYAQLTGTTVDYGKAHSEAHGHERFGRQYTTPLVPRWGESINGGQTVKINLIGHSFGGATVRLLTSLLANGDEAERAAGGDVSDLFKGGKEDWVFSVTALCAPHNGSQLTCIVDDLGGLAGVDDVTDVFISFAVTFMGAVNKNVDVFDVMLDQFGIDSLTPDKNGMKEAMKKLAAAGNDHSIYDLSPDGAAELNKKAVTVPGVYYISYSYSTTKDGFIGKTPISETLPILYPTAFAMGKYTGKTPGGITIDKSWQDNDGLVSVISAQFPSGEEHTALPTEYGDIKPGIWNVADTRTGDHGTVVGLNATAEDTCAFYDSLFEMLEGLNR